MGSSLDEKDSLAPSGGAVALSIAGLPGDRACEQSLVYRAAGHPAQYKSLQLEPTRGVERTDEDWVGNPAAHPARTTI
ncbi:MAG TPA: hypothetical protein VIN35_12715 [Hydrogenophaga sp.]